jgi:hypothetical protein
MEPYPLLIMLKKLTRNCVSQMPYVPEGATGKKKYIYIILTFDAI